MINKKLKFSLTILALCLVSILGTGCFSKKKNKNTDTADTEVEYEDSYSLEDQLRDEISQEYESQISATRRELTALKDQMALYDSKYKNSDSFKDRSTLQAGPITFNKVNDKIVLDKTMFKDSMMSSAGVESSINIGKFTLKPQNWTVKLNGNTLDLSIPNSAYGNINIYGAESKVKKIETLKEKVLVPFIKANDMEVQSSRDLYSNNKQIGSEVTARCYIKDTTTNGSTFNVPAISILDSSQLADYGVDSEGDISITINVDEGKDLDAFLRVGAAYVNNYFVLYNFIYTSDNGSILVDNLINSIKTGSNNFYLN